MPVLPAASLREMIQTVLQAAGTPEDLAGQVAEVLVDNHLAGHDSHGILRIPEYLRSIAAGEIVPTARPRVLKETATTALVGGNWALGQVTATFAVDLLAEKALREHVAAVAVVEANHTGRLAAFTERGARRGVATFMFIGSVERGLMAPFGGAAPLFGTNPISFSLPNPAGPPVTLDYATAAIAAGKIKVAKAKHEQLPEGAIMTADGQPSTDPQAFFDGGFLLPFGGHKGYALAVIAEILAGPLAGADAYPGVKGRTGICLFGLDASAFRPPEDYRRALADNLGRIKSVPPAPGFDEVLLPGEPEARSREQRLRDGIPVPDDTWRAVADSAAGVGVDISRFLPADATER